MSKIDIDKFVASLMEFSPQQSMKYIKALADQGLIYKDGQIYDDFDKAWDGEEYPKAIFNNEDEGKIDIQFTSIEDGIKINIPDGFQATIEDRKIILKREE